MPEDFFDKMKELLLFLKKISVVVLFLVLEGICLYFFFTKDTYMLSRYVLVSKEITVPFDRFVGMFSSYVALVEKNSALADCNARLISENMELKRLLADSVKAESKLGLPVVCAAKVLKNEYRYENNFITIDKGELDGVSCGMSVIDESGVVGFVSNTSSSFSVVVSVFNKDGFLTSAKLAGTSNTGSLFWDGKTAGILQLSEMPSHIDINVGDTVLTTSYSNIFPENIPVGRIKDFKISEGTFYSAEVETFTDVHDLNYVYVLEVKNKYERDSLESAAKLEGGILK